MNERITVRLSPGQILALRSYAKDLSITFSAALREHLVIAFRELKGREEKEKILSELKEKILSELDTMKSELRELRKYIKDLKVLYLESTNSEGSD